MSQIDVNAYLKRVGYRGPLAPEFELLKSLQCHHTAAIPFESLDPLLGRPVNIDPASLEKKLIRGGRGGYCFEQNGLFFHALSALDFAVTPLAARVRWTLPADAPQTPLSHMLLMVVLQDGEFICDVGFGGQSPTVPLRLASEIEQETPHGTYRLRGDGACYELEMRLSDTWATMYRFSREPQSFRDYEVFNWYTSTYPSSRFVNNLVAARVTAGGRLTLFNDELTLQRPDGRREHRLLGGAAEVRDVLTRDFGIRIGRAEIDSIWPRLPKRTGTDAAKTTSNR
ncbi:MAG: arylamine N-acetyltransferase family protein [Rhizomicrobium sp.]